MSYWCPHCPRDDHDIPIEDGMGFGSLAELGHHIRSEHPEELKGESINAFVEKQFDKAEAFIDEVIQPTIETLEAVEHENAPLSHTSWSTAVDKAINNLARVRNEIRRAIRRERNELHRPYFYTLARKYADHYAEYDKDDYNIRPTPYHRYIPKAMAYEASEELGYDVNEFLCLEYIFEELPEDHPSHDPDATEGDWWPGDNG